MTKLINMPELDSELTEYIHKYAFIMELQVTPIALFDATSTIIYANSALRNILNTNDLLPTLDQLNSLFRGVERTIISSIADNKSKKLNKNIKDEDVGQLIPYIINVQPVTYIGKCAGAIVFVETDIKCLVNYFIEEKLNLSNKISNVTINLKNTFNLVNALFDNSPVGMMILDEEKRIMQINKSGAVILDMKASSLIGICCSRFYTATSDNQLSVEESIKEEVYAVTATGKKKILLRCSVKSKNEGDESFSVETFIDVTEIEQARIAAEESNKVKSEFLANMSHELRTPLHSIIGFSQCGIEQTEKVDPEKASKFFNKIHQSGEVLLSLVNDLLDINTLDSGKVVFNFKPIRLEKIVKNVVKEFEILADSKDINIRLDVKNKTQSIDMDENRIQQVVRNIIDNAIKFTVSQSEIIVVVEQIDEIIQLRVYDQGPGIPEDELEGIFDKFIQSTRTNTGAGGSGLGLAICREILNQHNGYIWVENNVNGGSVFIVNLYIK